MTTIITLVGIAVYIALYFTYGRKLETDVVKASNDNETPAHRLFDGVDYVPAKTPVLFGHHFASVAGAAPIVGQLSPWPGAGFPPSPGYGSVTSSSEPYTTICR